MNYPKSQLTGKVAVVTGAGRGIGKAIALAFAKAGAVVSCAARTVNEIQETEREIKENGGQALAIQTDVTQLKSVENLFRKTVECFGGIDIVVINAGVNYDRRTVEESVPEDWKMTLEVNLIGAYNCAHIAIPYLKQRGAGKIITNRFVFGSPWESWGVCVCLFKSRIMDVDPCSGTRTLAV